MRCLACDECGFWPRKCGVWPRNAVAFGPRRHGGLGLPPPPLAGEGWGGGGIYTRALLRAPTLALPRKRERERTECGEEQTACAAATSPNIDHAGPTRSIIAASLGCGARRMAAAPAAASGCETWRERQNCTGASAPSRMRARAAQSR